MKSNIDIIHVPFALGSHRRGCDLGPRAIKHAGLYSTLVEKGYVLSEKHVSVIEEEDERDIHLKHVYAVTETANQTALTVAGSIHQHHFPLILGGDHSISVGTIAGIADQYDNLGVIWVDAHGDVNTHLTTPSGNIHGMPLAANLGYGDNRLTHILGFSPKIKPENVVILGVRELDEGEVHFLHEHNVTYLTMTELSAKGIDAVTKNIKTKFHQNGVKHLHVSFDLDSLDPSLVKGVGTPVEDGLSYEQAVTFLQEVKKWNTLVSCEFVEVNPLFDEKNETAKLTVSLINELF